MEWVRRWRVTVELRNELLSSPRTRRYERHVSTTAELRELIERARSHPHFLRHSEESLNVLDGREPQECPCGARYLTTGSLGKGVRGWLPCCCGGHFRYCCQRCAHVVIEPGLAFDCTAKGPP